VPTIRESFEIAGYDRDFDLVSPVQPGTPTSSKKTNLLDWRQITIDEQNRSIFLPTRMALDLGGVAKGWAAHQAMQRLGEIGPALMDAGGI